MTTTVPRIVPHLAWPILASIGAVAVGALAGAWDLGLGWRMLMLVSAAAALLTSIVVIRVRPVYCLIIFVGVLHLVTGVADQLGGPLTWTVAVCDAGIALAIVLALASAKARRTGRPTAGDLVDLSLVAQGLSLATWIFLTQPLIESGVEPALAIVASAIVPLATITTTLLVDLWSDGLQRNRSVLMMVFASIANLVGCLLSRVELIEGVGGPAAAPATAYSVAVAFVLAAALQPDVREIDSTPLSEVEHEVRLVLLGTAVLAPAALLATVPPSGNADLALRISGTVLLVGLVVARLAITVNDHQRVTEQLRRRADHDDLTDLPTRHRFVEIVAEALDETWRSERHPTIIQLNLDRFKNINDSFGHYGANEVLRIVACRLRRVACDIGGVAARVGGDDFAVLAPSTTSVAEADVVVEAIRATLAAPITIEESNVFLTASIGVAVAPSKRSLTADEFLRRSDIATHRAKTDGANRVAVFDDSMQANITERMDVEHALHGAIGRQEMRLYHQPIVDIVTGRVAGFEALMRWERSDGTLVSPASFIPVAEDTGMICELGAWALHDALRELRGWIDDGVVEPTTTVSVNVSPRQIADPEFAGIVRRALDESGVPPHLLWIEMTESMMLDEPELAQTTLREIRAMGVRLALDDFGTGFSSLSLLQQFPIQRIKIDRAFVQGIADNTNDRSLVRTIIAMARSMGLDLVAEGVETVHQLQELRQLGCDKAQGYLISHPVPVPAMRSTMSALSELAELSLFDAGRTTTVEPDALVGVIEDEPVAATSSSLPHVGTGLVGHSTSRPLGQPVL